MAAAATDGGVRGGVRGRGQRQPRGRATTADRGGARRRRPRWRAPASFAGRRQRCLFGGEVGGISAVEEMRRCRAAGDRMERRRGDLFFPFLCQRRRNAGDSGGTGRRQENDGLTDGLEIK